MRHRTQSGSAKQIPLAFIPMVGFDSNSVLRSAYTRLELSRRLSFEQVMSNRAGAQPRRRHGAPGNVHKLSEESIQPLRLRDPGTAKGLRTQSSQPERGPCAYRGRELCLSIDRRFRQIKCAIRCLSGRARLCRSSRQRTRAVFSAGTKLLFAIASRRMIGVSPNRSPLTFVQFAMSHLA